MERLARGIEALAVKAASGAFAAGHKFWGNQWSSHAQDAANDPAGEPSGKIRHAVLVIGGKRYKGPSHFQALQNFEKAGGNYEGAGTYAEGFETESGHFLDREQAAKYISQEDLNKWGKARLERLQKTKYLVAQDLPLAAVDGSLYTQDSVQASDDTGDVKMVAKVVVSNDAGQVLLLKEADGDEWDLPGGHLKDGEDPAAGAAREVEEETGLRLAVFGARTCAVKYGGNSRAVIVYSASVSGMPEPVLSDEHAGFKWVTVPEAFGMPVWGSVKTILWQSGAKRGGVDAEDAIVESVAMDVANGYYQAAEPISERESTLAHHRIIRSEAEHAYRKAVGRVVASLEASALADAKRKDGAKRRKRREEELEAAALLLFLAGSDIYRATSRKLAALVAPQPGYGAPGTNLGQTTAPQPTNAPQTMPGGQKQPSGAASATPAEPETGGTGGGGPLAADTAEAKRFAADRAKLLLNFPREVAERLDAVVDERGESETDEDLGRRLLDKAHEIEDGQGAVVASTEATATYGASQLAILQRAGFATCMWDQLDRPTKRATHEENMQLGEVPVGHLFVASNQRYPGDPAGGVENCANCLCQLVGVRRKPGTGHLQASEATGHPFRGNRWKKVWHGYGGSPEDWKGDVPIAPAWFAEDRRMAEAHGVVKGPFYINIAGHYLHTDNDKVGTKPEHDVEVGEEAKGDAIYLVKKQDRIRMRRPE